jgi:hypothetical protein
MNMKNQLLKKPVKIIRGTHKGRIGYYDDDDDTGKYAIVYFGDMDLAKRYYRIPHKYLTPVTTSDLVARHEEILTAIGIEADNVTDTKRAALLPELLLIESTLNERMFFSRLICGGKNDLFISHSSKDKQFARWLAVDLANAGHSPWLDEWQIRVGESIPRKISQGIESCNALIVILSEDAVASRWVENEWQAKYWDEITAERVRVLPILLKPCVIPTLLKTKKYADFTKDYNRGLEELLIALQDNP